MTILSGLFRLGRDAEIRHTAGGDAVATLSLAYNYGKKESDGNRPTQWVDAALWGKRAEALAQYLTKGTLIYAVLEDVHIETFERRDGGQGHKLAARVQDVEFTGRANEGGERSSGGDRPAQREQRQTPAKPASKQQGDFENMDDDIPF